MPQAGSQSITNPSRRALIAGASTLAAASAVNVAAIVAAKPAEQDPILGAIERHRAAYMRQMTSYKFAFDMADGPEKDAAQALAEPDYEAAESAAIGLTTIMPTTMAGVLALIDYAEEFNAGGVFLAADRRGWRSWPGDWPKVNITDQPVDIPDDEEEWLPFAWFMMRNVANALRAITVQS